MWRMRRPPKLRPLVAQSEDPMYGFLCMIDGDGGLVSIRPPSAMSSARMELVAGRIGRQVRKTRRESPHFLYRFDELSPAGAQGKDRSCRFNHPD